MACAHCDFLDKDQHVFVLFAVVKYEVYLYSKSWPQSFSFTERYHQWYAQNFLVAGKPDGSSLAGI